MELAVKKTLIATFLALGFALSAQAKDIVDTAVAAGNFKTLATALGAAGLVDTLKGKGPFTVFAPTDEAFAKIPKADLDALLKDKAKLSAVLTYHVVAGRLTAADIAAQAQANGGTATLTTVQGEPLKVAAGPNGTWVITDAKGGTSTITQADVAQSNGMVHVVDTVLMP